MQISQKRHEKEKSKINELNNIPEITHISEKGLVLSFGAWEILNA